MDALTRREFLSPRTLWEAAKKVIGPSGASPREVFTEISSEVLSWMMLAYQAYQGAHDKLLAYGVASEATLDQRPGFALEHRRLSSLAEQLGNLSSISQTLNRQWHTAYEESEEVCSTSKDSNGKETKSCYTRYYWDEPRPLNGFYQPIANWESVFGNIARLTQGVVAQSPTAFDLTESTKFLYLPDVEVAKTGPTLVSLVLRTVVGTGFAYYEEFARIVQEAASRFSLSDDELIISDRQAITRRSFLKLIAAALATRSVEERQKAFVKENATIADKIREFATNTLATTPTDRLEISRQELGFDPAGLVQYLTDTNNQIETALSKYNGIGFWGFPDNSWPPIRETLTQLQQTVLNLRTWTTQNFTEGNTLTISDEMKNILRSTKATRDIKNYVSGKRFEVEYSRHFVDSLIAGGQLFVSAGIIETINKITDPIVQGMNSALESN